jgi:hypothetical protein
LADFWDSVQEDSKILDGMSTEKMTAENSKQRGKNIRKEGWWKWPGG